MEDKSEHINVGDCFQQSGLEKLGIGLHPAGLQALYLPSLKTEASTVSDRDISGLTDGGSYTFEARSWSDTPRRAADSSWQDGGTWQESSLPREGADLPVIGELTSGGLISYQGNQQRGTPLTAPLISYQVKMF